MCARRRSNFLLSRQEKVTKEKATLLRASPSLRYGATCDARSGSATAELAARLRRSARTTAVIQCTKCVCPSAHARTPCPALLGTRRREPSRHPFGPLLRSAQSSRAQAPRAAKAGPGAAMARVAVGLFGSPAAGLPRSAATGSQTGGRLSFGYFSLAKQRTSTSPAGATPGSRPPTRHTAKKSPLTPTKPASPENHSHWCA